MKYCLLCKTEIKFINASYNEMGFCFKCAERIANEFWYKHSGEWLTYPNTRPAKEQSLRKKIKDSLRTLVMERCEYACIKCGVRKKLVIDHIVPISKGGTDEENNLQVLCWSCNSSKKNLSQEDWDKKKGANSD